MNMMHTNNLKRHGYAKQQMVERSKIRQQMRSQRNALSPLQCLDAARKVEKRIANSHLFRTSRHIACYFANDNELNLDLLIERLWLTNKCCYLPVLDSIHKNRLWFAPYRPESEVRFNRFGIPEPLCKKNELIRAQSLDLILMPLVAFDNAGNRLGMGGGFYDRSLAFLLRRRHWYKPRLCGVAYEFQRAKRLPRRPWDVPLHAIITDNSLDKPT